MLRNELLKVIKGNGDFQSKIVPITLIPKNSIVANINTHSSSQQRYSTIQISKHDHIELNSNLLYMNHSCSPNVFVDTSSLNIIALNDIQPNEEISFFYPSTEWIMAQPFNCWCKGQHCLKVIRGASELSRQDLKNHRLNQHILDLLDDRDAKSYS